MTVSWEKIKTIKHSEKPEIVELVTSDVVIESAQDALDLMANVSAEYFILHDYNLVPEFFDLSTGVAGEVLQKLTNYRIKLAVIGIFNKYPSLTLKDFMYESNRNREYIFVGSAEEALKIWLKPAT